MLFVDLGDSIVRWTVRLAVLFYVLRIWPSSRLFAISVQQRRFIWSLGCGLFLLHMIAAFQFVHGWSHLHALERTAEQTLEMTGFDSGVGLYVNYVFALTWTFDVVCWWVVGMTWPKKSRWLQIGFHSFFAFVMFNATVIFGPPFWTTLFVLAALLWAATRFIG